MSERKKPAGEGGLSNQGRALNDGGTVIEEEEASQSKCQCCSIWHWEGGGLCSDCSETFEREEGA
jgi:hypothetical protein